MTSLNLIEFLELPSNVNALAQLLPKSSTEILGMLLQIANCNLNECKAAANIAQGLEWSLVLTLVEDEYGQRLLPVPFLSVSSMAW